jgi:hypothetical protein
MELIHLWMQIRWLGKRKRIKLWDCVQNPDVVGMTGNPDIIYYDDFNPVTLRFKRLVFFELETSQKSDTTVRDKIEALIRNDFYFIVFVSKQLATLKQISSSMRKFIPTSSFYANKGSFSPDFFTKKAHLSRIWFLHWDSNKVQSNEELLNAVLRRADHPDFDHYVMTNLDGGLKFKRDKKEDRWTEGVGPTWNLAKLLNRYTKEDSQELKEEQSKSKLRGSEKCHDELQSKKS